jgi:hypothetical protein
MKQAGMLMNQQNPPLEENNSWNALRKWETLVDERIRALIGDGDMSGHPGAGKPLDLDESEYTPEEQRLAYKLMKEHDAIPAWMSLGFTLREKHERIHRRLQQYAVDYVRRKQDAVQAGSFILDRHADDRWNDAIHRLREEISRYNSELLDYNLQVPPQVGQMVPLNLAEMIPRVLDQAKKLADS